MSKGKIFLLGSLIFLLANLVYLLYFDKQIPNASFSYNNFYTFQAEIKSLDKKLHGWNILVAPNNLENFSGNILIYAPLYLEYDYGNIVEVACKIYQPEPIVDEQGQTFFYDKYLAKDKIYGTCFRPRLKIIGQSKSVYLYIFQAKKYFWNNLNSYLVEPASSLAKAMLLANRREISADLRANFAQVGLSHVIAISGLHMAIIIWLLQSFFMALGLSRKQTFGFLIIVLLAYLYLIAFPSSAVRASLMMFVVLLGPFLGRNTNSVYSLLLAADIFILINPYLLLYDIGFQLSFLAVLGLLYYVKFLNKVLIFIPQKFKAREVMAVTLSAQVFTWPLIIYNFGIFSIIAPLANFLILPLLPFILILSLILSLVGFISLLGNLFAWPLFILLKIIVVLAEFLAKIPGAYFETNGFSLIYMLIALGFMFLITWILKPQDYE